MTPHVRSLLLTLLLWLAGLGAAGQFAKLAVPFGQLRSVYPTLDVELGWLLSLVSLVGAALGIVAGSIVARFGPRPVLLLGLLIGAAVAFFQTAFPPFPAMAASRVIEGISHLAIVVAAPTLISQIVQPRLVGAAMTLWSTFFGVSFAIVAWGIMPFVGPSGLGRLLLGHGVYMIILAVFVWVFIPTPRRGTNDGGPASGLVATHKKAYSTLRLAGPGAGWLCYTLTFVSLLALLPERLPQDQAIWAAGLMPLVSIAVSLVCVPLMLRRMSSPVIVAVGFLLAMLLVVTSLWTAQGLVFVISLFGVLGLVQGASFSAVPELNRHPEEQALAYGLMAQMGNMGNLLGTPLLIFLSGFAGDLGMYVTIAVIYIFGMSIHLTLARRLVGQPGP